MPCRASINLWGAEAARLYAQLHVPLASEERLGAAGAQPVMVTAAHVCVFVGVRRRAILCGLEEGIQGSSSSLTLHLKEELCGGAKANSSSRKIQ